MNPKIPADYHETARWLEAAVRSHAKREVARIEALVDCGGSREGHSFGVRLVLDERLAPPATEAPIELGFHEVAEGRSRFDWCATLAERVRSLARSLVAAPSTAG